MILVIRDIPNIALPRSRLFDFPVHKLTKCIVCLWLHLLICRAGRQRRLSSEKGHPQRHEKYHASKQNK